MKYTRVLVSRYGGSEVLEIVQEDLRDASPSEVRLKVLAAGVAWPDLMMRQGVYPNQPKLPFTPGYDVIGTVDQNGPGATRYRAGQLVAAMLMHGGYSEYVFVREEELVPVPDGADPAAAVCLVLNYVTAYQLLHRVARLARGCRVLAHSAAGGVGTALLELGRIEGFEMFGTASKPKHALVRALGAEPIDYKKENFVTRIRELTVDGVDLVCDSIGGTHWLHSYRCLRLSGTLVAFGSQATLVNGRKDVHRTILTYATAAFLYLRPGKRRFVFYSITSMRSHHPQWFREDLAVLFDMLARGQIQPVIAERLPLSQARRANELIERGAVQGKIVLVFP